MLYLLNIRCGPVFFLNNWLLESARHNKCHEQKLTRNYSCSDIQQQCLGCWTQCNSCIEEAIGFWLFDSQDSWPHRSQFIIVFYTLQECVDVTKLSNAILKHVIALQHPNLIYFGSHMYLGLGFQKRFIYQLSPFEHQAMVIVDNWITLPSTERPQVLCTIKEFLSINKLWRHPYNDLHNGIFIVITCIKPLCLSHHQNIMFWYKYHILSQLLFSHNS